MVKKRKRYLTPSEFARSIGVTTMTIYRWIWEGRIKAYELPSGRIRIPVSELKKTRKRKIKK
jgi:putative resolvase